MRAAFIFNFILIFIYKGFLLLWLVVGFPLAKPAFSMNNRCSAPVFGVSNVFIDQRAKTAAMARDIGIRKAAEYAFSAVLDRVLLSNEERSRFMDAHDLDDFADFTHIVNEKNLDQRYIATLDFCFDPNRMRQAMISAQLSWAELQSPPILVIPVWTGPDGARAWDRDNNWIFGWWDKVATYDGLLSFRKLDRSLINERQFRGEDLVLASVEKLTRAADLVDAEQVMLVIASLDYDGSNPLITITAQLYDKNGQMITDILFDDHVVVKSAVLKDLDLIRQKIISQMDTSWHITNLIDDRTTDYITVLMPITSIKEWTKRLKSLDEIAMVQSYDILSLTTQAGRVSIRFAGSREALQNALAAHRLQLLDTGNDYLIRVKPSDG
ncbi:hypothetical protein N8500_08960 [Candidatus Puniceispirillum sp.]|nr:hypothetical protein [Candidatus Puniceispirillum sp.]